MLYVHMAGLLIILAGIYCKALMPFYAVVAAATTRVYSRLILVAHTKTRLRGTSLTSRAAVITPRLCLIHASCWPKLPSLCFINKSRLRRVRCREEPQASPTSSATYSLNSLRGHYPCPNIP
jgi:hypothetical protein